MDNYEFIINTTVNHFKLNRNEISFDESAIKDFLNDEKQKLLSAKVDNDKTLKFDHRVPDSHQKVLLFYKNVINGNDTGLGILTIEGGIMFTIYSSISSLLYKSELNKNEYSPELINSIESLRSQISVSLGLAETGISSIKDEIQFWRQKVEKSSTKSDKEAAKVFAQHFEGLNVMIDDSSKTKSLQNLRGLEDLIDRIQYALDEIWRLENFKYPQNRMVSLLDLLSSFVVERCVDELNLQDDVWSLNAVYMNELINDVMDVLNNWNTICDSLTRLFWTNCESHLWLGSPHASQVIEKFKTRLMDILDIWKKVHQQISILTSEDSTFSLSPNDYFSYFKSINIYDITPIGEKFWNISLHKFENAFSTIDEKIALNIKFSIQTSIDNPQEIINIFSQFENILKSHKIRNLLKIECNLLFEAIKMYVVKLEKSLSSWKRTQPDELQDEISHFVIDIRYLKVIEYQVNKLNSVCKNILTDHENYDEVMKIVDDFNDEIKTALKQNFNDWCENSSTMISSGELILKDNEPVVRFETTDRQQMTATYSEKLVIFCNDVSSLRNFGFMNLPNELLKYASIGRKYIKYAKNLQQISSFHNTIGDKIIPCHRPIMLKNAKEFSSLVRSESVSWNNEDSVQRYINILQSSIDNLSKDLNLLTSYHEKFKCSILRLMNTDMLKHSPVWKDEMKTLREHFVDLERKGYTNLQLFKVHWDYQLYKALEYQLVSLLIDSREKLQDIHIDIVFRNQQLQFRPTMEEIRFEYYQQIKKYIEMPLSFHGFSDKSKEIFSIMVHRNRSKFKSLYDRAERNFKRLTEFRDLWLPWIAIGCMNLENLCNVHLTQWEHWDKNFKSCKLFSQKIAKIQKSEERIDCLVVNVEPIRSHIEFMARSFWETLSITLRSSILEDNSILHEYITSSLNVLQQNPTDESSIISASFKYDKIVNDLPKMTELFQIINSKNNCLMGWCKESVGSLDSLIQQWERLLPLIDNHHVLIQGQVESIKENLKGKIKNLNDETEKYLIKFEDTLKDLESDPDFDIENFNRRKLDWNEFVEKRDVLIFECEKFNASSFIENINESFKKVGEEISRLEKDWIIYLDFWSEMREIEQEEWSIFRRKPSVFTEFLSRWETKTSNLNFVPAIRVKKQVESYRKILPILTLLQTDAMNDKHWSNIFRIMDMKPKSYHDIKLIDMLKSDGKIFENSENIKSVVHQAHSEQIVRQAISELEQWADTAELKLFSYLDNNSETIFLIKDFKDCLNKIGDNQCLLNTSKNAAAVENFIDSIEIWEKKLNLLNYVLSNLSQIQKKWIYLEPIFSNGAFKNGESSFKRIDKDFRFLMRNISSNQKVVSLVKISNIEMIIESSMNQLNQCQNTLSKYMTEKRDLFPRFYFLSDDDLLEILGQSEKDNILQKHINKLFPGINKLILSNSEEKNFLRIKGMMSTGGDEYIQLSNEVLMDEVVEKSLTKLENEIKKTLKSLVYQCFHQNDMSSIDSIEKFPMQVLCLIKSVQFTSNIEKSISTMSLQNLLLNIKSEISNYSFMLQKTANQVTQMKIRALLIDLVHQVTTVEYLLKHNVTDQSDWHWLQQIKFYFNSRNELITIKMVKAEFEYSYEFLGLYNKLVYTALTHNCYLTLTQAMVLGLGGNPFGQAGTGKTECVKSLGAMMGRMVLVFNCNENIDTSAMALILTGISRCGAWACFDEFNRLQEDTLSAIAMLIQPLQAALKDKKDNVQLLDKNIPLNRHSSIFVTLNPVDEDYGGRNQLPANLQSLFRPIVMKQPEPIEIAKVMLFIEGFKHAEEIGERIVELFDLSSKLLSTQRHYDWGLRELKTILVACGKALRHFYSQNNETELTLENEMKLVVRSIKPNVKSKLTLSDRQRFEMLMGDVFPQTTENLENLDKSIRDKVIESISMMGLSLCEKQVDKCIEIYEQLSKRTGVCLFGPPSSGKSTCIMILKSAFSMMSHKIRTYVISPKSMDRSKLLGFLDLDTRQWHDGVLTQTAVAVNSEPLDVTSWIICDGDVDPEWIEALNSVLDDNKLLTLPSGWRIQFGNNVNFIFETHELSNASPATISRMGIINFSSEDLSPEILIKSWISTKSNGEMLEFLFDKYFSSIFKKLSQLSEIFRVVHPLSVSRAILSSLPESISTAEEFVVEIVKVCNLYLQPRDRNKFTNEILDEFNIYITNVNQAEHLYFNKFRNQIETYSSEEIHQTYENDMTSNDPVLFQNSSVKSISDTLRILMKSDSFSPFMLIGPHGIGKTLMISSVVAEMSGYQLIVINCSAQLSTHQVLTSIKEACLVVSGFMGKEYKPKQPRLIMLFKNIDLLNIDAWGTCDVVELLLQICNRNGFYGDNLEWVSIHGLQICGTLSDFKNHRISPRFLSKNILIIVNVPTQSDMKNTTLNFLNISGKKVNKKTSVSRDKLADIILDCFNEVSTNFTPDKSCHYHFSPKMIERWINGMSFYRNEDYFKEFFYEFSRIFGDRMISDEHREIFKDIISNNIKYLECKFDESDTFFINTSEKYASLQCVSKESWISSVEKNMIMCNTETSVIDTPMTPEFLRSVSSVVRALSRPGSNICISGMLGSGRFDSVAVACTLLNMTMMFPNMVENYSSNDFTNDLKSAMQACGLENKIIVFYIDQVCINFLPSLMKICEAILEGGLSNYNVFGDDLESVANTLKNEAQLAGYHDNISTFFLERIKHNLHLVIALDISSSNFNEVIKTYRCLYEKTEFIWMSQFSLKTKRTIFENIVELMKVCSTFNLSESSSFKNIDCIIDICDSCMESPKRFVQLIKAYLLIHNKIEKVKKTQESKLECGIQKLSDAYKYVAKLKEDAKEKEKALAEKRHLAKQALEMISHTMKSANDQKSDMLKLKTETEEKGEILKQRKLEIEKELSLVEPLLKEASVAVGSIKSEALSEIRSLRAPPETIRDILEGVLRLMGIRDTSWNSMKSFLAKRGVKEDIRSLNPSLVSEENCAEVERLIASRPDSFDFRTAKRASAVAAPLANWVIACVKYCQVVQSIKPLEREQRDLQRNLESTENQMKSLSTGIDDVNVKVEELSSQLNVYTQEAAVLEIKLEDTRTTLKSTEVLVDKLSSEFNSWSGELEVIRNEMKNIDNESIMTSLCLSYFSHLQEEERRPLIEKSCEEIRTSFDLHRVLYTDQDKLIWESLGLLPDKQSAENASILLKILELPFGIAPVPLILDPTENTLKWLSSYLNMKNDRKYEILYQNDDRFTYNVELGIRFGKTLIIGNITQITACVFSLLRLKIHCRFGKKFIHVGNKFVDFHEEFRLILVTHGQFKESDIDFNKNVTIIPFTLTTSSLTDQLLSKWIALKNPDEEKKRIELLKNEGKLTQEKSNLQEKLLEELTHAEGDILKNEKLLSTLNDIKEKTIKIESSLIESNEIRSKLLDNNSQSKSVCTQSAEFYIKISKIYRIDYKSFIDIFLNVFGKQSDVDEFLHLYKDLVKKTFYLISRSIKESEHTQLSLNVIHCAFPKLIPNVEWELFIFNFTESETSAIVNMPSWIKKELVPKLTSLNSQCPNFFKNLNLDNDHEWIEFINATENIPKTFPNTPKITEFQKLLVYQIFRPDFLLPIIQQISSKMLGMKEDSFQQPRIRQLLAETEERNEPILIIAGSTDPTSELIEFSKTLNVVYREVFIGEEKDVDVLNLLTNFANNGGVLCFKNVHLRVKIIEKNESIIKSIKLHKNFRIVYTCENDKNLSTSILMKCKTFVMEPPSGIKFKILSLFEQNQKIFKDKLNGRQMKICVAIFILHSILLECQNYIPQGWCKWYDFCDADIKASLDFFWSIKSNANNIDWTLLRGFLEKIVYGGRVDNGQDMKKLILLIKHFFDEKIMVEKWNPRFLNVNIPTSSRLEDYQNLVMKVESTPEMLGLSHTSIIAKNIMTCRNLLKDLRKTHINTDDTLSLERRVRPLMILWKKSVQTFELPQFNETNDKKFNPYKIFKSSEISISKEIVNTISETLTKFSTIDFNSLSKSNRKLLLILCDNSVPYEWKKIWKGPKLATDYLKAVTIRVRNAMEYYNCINEPIKEIDLATIFKVDSFLSSLKIAASAELDIAPNNLILESSCDEKVCERMQNEMTNIVKVHPLYIDGLSMENKYLGNFKDSTSRNLTCSFYIFYREVSNIIFEDKNKHEIPIYSTSTRNDILCTVNLSSLLSKDDIIYSGTALLVNSN